MPLKKVAEAVDTAEVAALTSAEVVALTSAEAAALTLVVRTAAEPALMWAPDRRYPVQPQGRLLAATP